MGCGGTGIVECFCAGDFCACSIQGTGSCEGCVDCSDAIHYAEHYDATQGKGLCWSGCGRKVFKYKIRLNDGSNMNGESLWCVECKIKQGDIVDERDSLPA